MDSVSKSRMAQLEADSHFSFLEQQKELNSGIAAKEQQEEIRKYETGEKRNLSLENDLSNPKPDSSTMSDNNLHPPPSYFGTTDSVPTFDGANKTIMPNNATSFGPCTNSYDRLLIKNLRFETRRQLGLRLDIDLHNAANWKSVADEIGFTYLEIQNFDRERHKTQYLLSETEVRYPQFTVSNLCEILRELEREDVITDMEKWFQRDLKSLTNPGRSYSTTFDGNSFTPMPSVFGRSNSGFGETTTLAQQPSDSNNPIQHPFISTSADPTSSCEMYEKPRIPSSSAVATSPIPEKSMPENSQISSDMSSDTSSASMSQQQPPAQQKQQVYDAFVLYDSADKDFILKEFLPKIEGQAGIRLFLPERDAHAGSQTYHGQLEAMVLKCPKLVVILSDEFLKTPSSQWGLNVGVSLDPAAKRRKIIPVIYKRLTEMSILGGINACDRTRVLEDSWFWDSLVRSLRQ